MSTAKIRELLCGGVGIIHSTQGLARTYYVPQRPGADTEETGRYTFSVERFV